MTEHLPRGDEAILDIRKIGDYCPDGAYGANVVTCKQGPKYFEDSDIKAGPRSQTLTVKVG